MDNEYNGFVKAMGVLAIVKVICSYIDAMLPKNKKSLSVYGITGKHSDLSSLDK